jgi:hypothetical protein
MDVKSDAISQTKDPLVTKVCFHVFSYVFLGGGYRGGDRGGGGYGGDRGGMFSCVF